MDQEGLVMPHPGLPETHPYNAGLTEEESGLAKRRGVATDKGAKAIGERLALLRKERGVTQTEIADTLGVSQPVYSGYERGELRVHGELLASLAGILKVSADEILGLEKSPPSRAPRDRRLLRRLQDVDKLSKRDREALMRTLDAFLNKVHTG
jgi:transcriptional regulator with XRE-family HTH domain